MGVNDIHELTRPKSISDFLAAWLEGRWLSEPDQGVLLNYYQSYVRHFGPYLRYHYCNQTVELLDKLNRSPDANVLEVGCGCGTESLFMALQGAHVLGLDVRHDRLAVASSRLQLLKRLGRDDLACRFEARSVFDITAESQFDIIWMEQAFHHIEPRRDALGHFARLLKPGGSIVISEANGWNPVLQLSLLRKRGFNTIASYTDSQGQQHVYGNERITTPVSLRRLLREAGLEASSLRYFRLFPNWRIADRLLNLERFMPSLLKPAFTHFNLVARKIAA
jgi:2-polyprenyl-3-methyl-5-hydroxy-6-metoxy-1,4-benzoquinol methylase